MTTMNQSFGVQSQQGATLIVVMLVLLLIMVAGAMSVRQSRVDLQVATGDQINTVLLQTADNANHQLEGIVNGDINSADYNDILLRSNGLFGYFISSPDDHGQDEFIYCQGATNKDYITSVATVRKGTGGTVFNNGYCGKGGTFSYTSGRNVMVGQVSVTPTPFDTNIDAPLSDLPLGQDINGLAVKRMKFDIRSTSAVPAYSNANMDDVSACFSNTSIPKGTAATVSSCLQQLNVPETTVYQQAYVSEVTEISMCTHFGTNPTGFVADAKCQTR